MKWPELYLQRCLVILRREGGSRKGDPKRAKAEMGFVSLCVHWVGRENPKCLHFRAEFGRREEPLHQQAIMWNYDANITKALVESKNVQLNELKLWGALLYSYNWKSYRKIKGKEVLLDPALTRNWASWPKVYSPREHRTCMVPALNISAPPSFWGLSLSVHSWLGHLIPLPHGRFWFTLASTSGPVSEFSGQEFIIFWAHLSPSLGVLIPNSQDRETHWLQLDHLYLIGGLTHGDPRV
jgi:hypothetical protein